MHEDDSARAMKHILSNPLPTDHTQMIELTDGGRLRYVPNFIESKAAVLIYQLLRDHVPWEQMRFRGHDEPRLTYWMADFPYRYSGVTRKPAPRSLLVDTLIGLVEKFTFGDDTSDHFDGVLLNYYRSGLDKIGLHSDAEPDLKPRAPIASLSFGGSRRFVLRHNHSKKKVEVTLEHGSLLLMEGTTQEYWKHEILAEPRLTFGRINLTMRCLAEVAR